MQVLILGMGNVGCAVASALRSAGHRVVGTTTRSSRLDELNPLADSVHVLTGGDTDKVREAAKDCDAVVVTVSPQVARSRTVEERMVHYRETLVDSCRSAIAACTRVIFASSFSVYGDGGNSSGPITESTPCANHEEPSSRFYQMAEQAVLASAEGCALRFPDIYGAPGDLSYPQRVRLCHEVMGGKAVFAADAPLYCIHYEDAAGAIVHALVKGLTGLYNVCDNDRLPATNGEVFNAICLAENLPPLEFLGHIKAPTRRISAARIYATGYRVTHPDPNAQWVQAGGTGI